MALYGNCIVPTGFDPKAPIGTGPFKLTSFPPGNQVVFAPNEHYFGEVPHVDTLTVIEFADPAARVNALLGGTVDAISDLPSAEARVVTGAGLRRSSTPTPAPGSPSPCASTRSRSTTCACVRRSG